MSEQAKQPFAQPRWSPWSPTLIFQFYALRIQKKVSFEGN